jgi:hypothetical protein
LLLKPITLLTNKSGKYRDSNPWQPTAQPDPAGLPEGCAFYFSHTGNKGWWGLTKCEDGKPWALCQKKPASK